MVTTMSKPTTMIGPTSTAAVSDKMFMDPPTNLVEGQAIALETLRSVVSELYPFSSIVRKRSTGKKPTKARLFTLHHITVCHRNSLVDFLCTEFVTPIHLLPEYAKLYANVMASMHSYALLVDSEQSVNKTLGDPGAEIHLESVNSAITRAWRLAQEVVTNLEKSQRRIGEISVSWRETVQWMDRVVAMEDAKSGTAWCSELLCDVLVRLEGLKESYRPLIEFFTLQEAHLRVLQANIMSDVNSRVDHAHQSLTVGGLRFPSPPVIPCSWDTVQERAGGVVKEWGEFIASKVFLQFHHSRYLFIMEIRATLEHEKEKRGHLRSRRVSRAVSRLFHTSEINAH